MDIKKLTEININMPMSVKVSAFLLIFGAIGMAGWFFREKRLDSTKNVYDNRLLYATEKMVYVHISGEVNLPGLYSLRKGARLGELVKVAGGLTKYGEISSVNLAELLKDGQKVIIQAKTSNVRKIGIGSGPEEKYLNPPLEVKKD